MSPKVQEMTLHICTYKIRAANNLLLTFEEFMCFLKVVANKWLNKTTEVIRDIKHNHTEHWFLGGGDVNSCDRGVLRS